MRFRFILLLTFLLPVPLWAIDELTQYDLLAPETHSFAIRYDTAATTPGTTVYYNIIRPGSEARDEKVIDLATGKEIPFVLADGKEAKAAGQAEPDTPDETKFIKIALPHPVPEQGEFRLRIWKTYRDPKSYYTEGDTIVFERGLSIQRNVILLPAGYELIRSSVPVIVGTEAGGRIKVSMFNDRNDELAVKIAARKMGKAK
jgi:hypothetical protein